MYCFKKLKLHETVTREMQPLKTSLYSYVRLFWPIYIAHWPIFTVHLQTISLQWWW